MYSVRTIAQCLGLSGVCAVMVLPASHVAGANASVSINPPTRPQSAPMTVEERRKIDLVMAWRRDVIEARHMERAGTYLAEDYIEHDPNIAPGRTALVDALSKAPSPSISKQIASQPVVQYVKGDFILLIFESQAVDPRDPTKIYYYNDFDLFRIQGGKLAEHWNSNKKFLVSPDFVASSAPAPSQWNTGTPSASERRNIGVATEEHKDILQYGHLHLADKAIAKDYIQHNPNVPQGREGFKRYMARPAGTPVETIKPDWKSAPALILASGPYVLMMWTWSDKDPTDANKHYLRNHFDLLRINDGQAQEHWDESRIADPGSSDRSLRGSKTPSGQTPG